MTYNSFKYAILSGFLLTTTQITLAVSPTDQERAKKVAQATVQLFSNQNQENAIKFGMAMFGISEAQARTNLKENADVFINPLQQMEAMLKEQFSTKDLKVVLPAFEKQMQVQGEIMSSCKISGKITQIDAYNFQFPLNCQVPRVDFATVLAPVKGAQQTDAEYFVTTINWMNNLVQTAPRQNFSTNILIHKQGDSFIPEMDDENYFPSSVTKQITGASESEIDAVE